MGLLPRAQPADVGFASHVADKRVEFRASLPADRANTFDPIKVEGITESGLGVVVTHDQSRGGGHVLGRATITDTSMFSTVLALQNLWPTATAAVLGVGWVSFSDEPVLSELIGMPGHVQPIARLCVGHVAALQQTLDLERFGWRARRPLTDVLHTEHWTPHPPTQLLSVGGPAPTDEHGRGEARGHHAAGHQQSGAHNTCGSCERSSEGPVPAGGQGWPGSFGMGRGTGVPGYRGERDHSGRVGEPWAVGGRVEG